MRMYTTWWNQTKTIRYDRQYQDVTLKTQIDTTV